MCFRSVLIYCSLHPSQVQLEESLRRQTLSIKATGGSCKNLIQADKEKRAREKISPFILFCSLIPLSLYMAVVNLLKICGHKFNTTQVDRPTASTQIRTHKCNIHAGGWAAERQNRAIFQRNNKINRAGR